MFASYDIRIEADGTWSVISLRANEPVFHDGCLLVGLSLDAAWHHARLLDALDLVLQADLAVAA